MPSASPSTGRALMTLAAYAVVVLLAIGVLWWIFTRPAAQTSTASPTPTPQEDGTYNIDQQLDML